MPELPDVLLYVAALKEKLAGETIRSAVVRSPSLLKTYRPDLEECVGRVIADFSQCGKRVVWQLDGELYLVFHLMIAGRFHWKKTPTLPRRKQDLAAFGFDFGTLLLTEASPKKRAGLWCLEDWSQVEALHAGGWTYSAAMTTHCGSSCCEATIR